MPVRHFVVHHFVVYHFVALFGEAIPSGRVRLSAVFLAEFSVYTFDIEIEPHPSPQLPFQLNLSER